MEFIPTSTIVIDQDTGVTLLNDEDMSLSLPDHAEVHSLKGSILSIADKEYIVVEATTEPKFNDDCEMIGTYVFLTVAKKTQN